MSRKYIHQLSQRLHGLCASDISCQLTIVALSSYRGLLCPFVGSFWINCSHTIWRFGLLTAFNLSKCIQSCICMYTLMCMGACASGMCTRQNVIRLKWPRVQMKSQKHEFNVFIHICDINHETISSSPG